MNNTGYFDAYLSTMALLHTWSLAIEEQFYVVWPLVLILLAKFMRPTSRPFSAQQFGCRYAEFRLERLHHS